MVRLLNQPEDRIDSAAFDRLRNIAHRLENDAQVSTTGEPCFSNVTVLEPAKEPLDSVAKLLVRDVEHKPAWVIYLSPPSSPQTVASCVSKMSAIKTALGPALGEVILSPISKGEVDRCTYAVVPYFSPANLDSGGVRYRVRRAVFGFAIGRWLSAAVARTRSVPHEGEIERKFITPLRKMMHLRGLSHDLRNSAQRALNRIESEKWEPLVAMEHGDLWSGNVLLPSSPSQRNKRRRGAFVLVDWYGSHVRGRPIYDLVRMAMSFRFGRNRLRREIRKQMGILNCSETDAIGYLLASLGSIALQPDHFPMDRFLPLAQGCYCCLASATGRP